MKQIDSIAPSGVKPEDRFGRQIAARLDESAELLHHDIAERLRIARQQALARHRQLHLQPVQALQAAGGPGVAALGGAPEEDRWWMRWISLLPLAALIAGLIAIQTFGADGLAHELAEIDEAILTDDLPPDAYTDPGFAQYLKIRLNQRNQD